MTYELENRAYRLAVSLHDKEVLIRLHDSATASDCCDRPYLYRASYATEEGSATTNWLQKAAVDVSGDRLTIHGWLAGLSLQHTFYLPADQPWLEEQITLSNPGSETVNWASFAFGFQQTVADALGRVQPAFSSDRLVALPFRHRPTDPTAWDNDYAVSDLLRLAGREHRTAGEQRAHTTQRYGHVPTPLRFSEGWAWMHGEHSLGIFKFNQETMEYSILAVESRLDGVVLRFGGAELLSADPSPLASLPAGQQVSLGVTRYQTVVGDYVPATYALRAFLDENGCRFPADFNPPVHWNELYDNPEWHVQTAGQPASPQMTRPTTYTRAMLLGEAAKAQAYGCEALYLDPGWDTDFATFFWGEAWLGPRKSFIDEIQQRYGLKLSLHTPLATWMSRDGRALASWPQEALRKDPNGNIIAGSICLGAKQYLDEAEQRLLAHCADGVAYLMFDGNWWNGGCWNPDHGHPVPYTMEDHCRANLDLAQRIHSKYPHVIIEMHDMICGGSRSRYTPVYYKYGLPGSYDDNWGFELMWQTMEDIRSGRARSLYYYNLGCNVPIYLHIDLRDDNEHCLTLWWYASTCRHLGIGGTHHNPLIAQAHKQYMQRYRKLDRFYKRGDFYGLSEEFHIHALPGENAFVINLFNLSDESRIMKGAVRLLDLGLDPNCWYTLPKGGHFDRNTGEFRLEVRLSPWSTYVGEVWPAESAGQSTFVRQE